MFVWLLVLLLLIISIYVVFKFFITDNSFNVEKINKPHYTFKI